MALPREWNDYVEACLRSSATSDGGILALGGRGDEHMLLLLRASRAGRSHPDHDPDIRMVAKIRISEDQS